jgi:hypothetical protein
MSNPKVTLALKHLRHACELADGSYAHYDEGMRRWYVVTADDLEHYADCLQSDDPAIARDAYSHWCAGTQAVEMPKDWEPTEAEQRGTGLR